MPLRSLLTLSYGFFLTIIVTCACLFSASPANSTKNRVDRVTTTVNGRIDLCLSCHDERPDKAHAREILGCAICHKGNPLAGDELRAHRGMVLNPGELQYADETCGQTGCHPREVKWVKNSLMATNRGIISTLRYYWGETDDHNESISVARIRAGHMKSPALDYYRKMCGSCHLSMKRHSLPGFLAEKGGGCTACHLRKPPVGQNKKGVAHIQITRNIPMSNCIKCHNRSGRIGLSYQGKFESEGYGTPYQDGGLSHLELIDGRFFQKMQPDIHYEKGLICIDCHTQKEVMGNGTSYPHFEDQLQVKCISCHTNNKNLEILARQRATRTNRSWTPDMTAPPLLNIKKTMENAFVLEGKRDKRPYPLKPPDPTSCKNPVHKRLSCQACHSRWVPQCYGCHVRDDRSQYQLDKLDNIETPGRWQEYRSFMRFESPALGVLKEKNTAGEEIVLLVPG